MKLLARILARYLMKSFQDHQSNLFASANLVLTFVIFVILSFRFLEQRVEVLMRAILKVISQTIAALLLI